MCLAIPGQILELLPDNADLARVDVSGVRRVINIGLLDQGDVRCGDWILIHVGFALSKIDESEARETLRFLEGIGDAYAEELMALRSSVILHDGESVILHDGESAILHDGESAILHEAEEVPDAVRG